MSKGSRDKGESEDKLRKAVIEAAVAMSRSGLSPNRSGNVSCRFGDGMLITPTALAYDDLKPRDIVAVNRDGSVRKGERKPSSEWHFHLAAYDARPDMHALVHTHSLHAVVLACAGKSIPPFHYMVAVAGGKDIPLVPYATFGTEELARHVAHGLRDRKACLMAHHGVAAMGTTLASALELAREVEVIAEQYYKVLTLNAVRLIPDDEMDRVIEKFKGYGQNALEGD